MKIVVVGIFEIDGGVVDVAFVLVDKLTLSAFVLIGVEVVEAT